ncbi:MAG: hypothetical protein V3S82_08815 [Dehalococcoidia bacterium]
MSIKRLFILNAVVFGIFGIGLMIAPALLLSFFYDASTDATGIYGIRSWAAASFGQAILSWLVRDLRASDAKHAIVIAFFAMYTLGFIIDIGFQISGVFNAFGWSSPVIAGFFALAFGYYALIRPEK